MARERKECSIKNYFKKSRQQVQESVVVVATKTSGPELYVFLVSAYDTETKSLDFLNYITPCERQFD